MGWGFVPLALWGALTVLLVLAGVEDARRREIANWKNAAIALLAPLHWWAAGYGWVDVAVQLGVAVLVFALFVLAFRFGWMGGGDVKMIGALALWAPLSPLLSMLMTMSVIGGVLTLVMLVDHRRRRAPGAVETPYGVAIAMAALLVLAQPLVNHFA